MGAAKEMWMAEYERIGEDLYGGEITEEEARQRMKSLGLDPGEIQDHIDQWKLENGE